MFNIKKKVDTTLTKVTPRTKEEIRESRLIRTTKEKADAPIINVLVRDFMDTLGALEINNREKIGFSLLNIEVHNYGCSARIYAPYGMILTDLEKYTSLIETGCKCKFIYNILPHNQFAMAKFIKPEQVKINSWDLKAIKVKPYEFCPGYAIDGKPLKFNLNVTPHILIAGQTRRGKNGAADHAIASWINSCDETEITFYMLQGANNDLEKYKFCKQVYCYAETLKTMLEALEYLVDVEMKRRKELFSPMMMKGTGKDTIAFYNETHSITKLSYIIVAIDEFIVLMADSTVDSPETKKLKGKILNYIQQIGQFGGKVGVNYLILHQKPSAVLMPVFVKNMSSVRVCFGFDDLVCAEIVLGPGLAKNAYRLPHWRAYYSDNDTEGFMYTPNMSKGVASLIASSVDIKHRTLKKDLEKADVKHDVIPIKVLEDLGLKVNRSIPKPEVIKKTNGLGDNILDTDFACYMSKPVKKVVEIPNYVPYEPPDEVIIKKETIPPPEVKEPREHSKIAPKTDNEILLASIKKIKGFVPYIPPIETSINITKNTDNKEIIK